MLPPSPVTSAAPSAEPAANRAPGARSRVLVVEDNFDAARLLEILLRTREHKVSVAYDGRSALRRAREERPDVIIIDIGLPDMSGYELARLIRADASLQGVQLIALTGYGEAAARAMTAASGFDHHLVKPLDRGELDRVLDVTPPDALCPEDATLGEARQPA